MINPPFRVSYSVTSIMSQRSLSNQSLGNIFYEAIRGSLTNLKNELNYIIVTRHPENQIPRVLYGARFVSPRRLSEPERRLHRQSFRHSSFMSHDFTFNQPDQSIWRCFSFLRNARPRKKETYVIFIFFASSPSVESPP